MVSTCRGCWKILRQFLKFHSSLGRETSHFCAICTFCGVDPIVGASLTSPCLASSQGLTHVCHKTTIFADTCWWNLYVLLIFADQIDNSCRYFLINQKLSPIFGDEIISNPHVFHVFRWSNPILCRSLTRDATAGGCNAHDIQATESRRPDLGMGKSFI